MQLLLTSHSTHIASKLKLENTVVLFNDQEADAWAPTMFWRVLMLRPKAKQSDT